MKQCVFNVRFRMEQSSPNELIVEYPDVNKNTGLRLRVPLGHIRYIVGGSNVVYMMDDAESLGASLVEANYGRGIAFDANNQFLYMSVRGVELQEDGKFIRFLGLTADDDVLCIACDEFSKEVVKNA